MPKVAYLNSPVIPFLPPKLSRTALVQSSDGSNDYSDSKTMNSSLSLIIDNQPVAVSRSSYKEAGMGYCGTRTNFYLVKINEDFVFLDLGQHTLTIKGTANDNLILSGVSVLAW